MPMVSAHFSTRENPGGRSHQAPAAPHRARISRVVSERPTRVAPPAASGIRGALEIPGEETRKPCRDLLDGLQIGAGVLVGVFFDAGATGIEEPANARGDTAAEVPVAASDTIRTLPKPSII